MMYSKFIVTQAADQLYIFQIYLEERTLQLIVAKSQKRDQRWKNGNNEMKDRKPDVDRKEDTKGMPRKEQVAISRLSTGYTSTTHGS
jgi:hypothetical protein